MAYMYVAYNLEILPSLWLALGKLYIIYIFSALFHIGEGGNIALEGDDRTGDIFLTFLDRRIVGI